jgi:hypothetical protein
MKKQYMKTMDEFVEEPKLTNPVFGENINVDVEDFLNSCDLVRTTQVVHVMFVLSCFAYTQIAKKIMAPIFECVQCVEVATCVPYCIFTINNSKLNNM